MHSHSNWSDSVGRPPPRPPSDVLKCFLFAIVDRDKCAFCCLCCELLPQIKVNRISFQMHSSTQKQQFSNHPLRASSLSSSVRPPRTARRAPKNAKHGYLHAYGRKCKYKRMQRRTRARTRTHTHTPGARIHARMQERTCIQTTRDPDTQLTACGRTHAKRQRSPCSHRSSLRGVGIFGTYASIAEAAHYLPTTAACLANPIIHKSPD